MNAKDNERATRLADAVQEFDTQVVSLPGIRQHGRLEALVGQFIDSLRRVEFTFHIRDTQISHLRLDPTSEMFDPLRAAVLQNRAGTVDDAWWLVFLATHFGKHSVDGWRLTRDIYGRLGGPGIWDWAAISSSPGAFSQWLAANEATLNTDGITRRFSNHRKYESLKSQSSQGTAKIIESYVSWIAPFQSHTGMVQAIHKAHGQNPEAVFFELYKSMDRVLRFGRLAKFDFLTMLSKLGIAPIEAGSAFLQGSTGPLRGARLLFGGTPIANIAATLLDQNLRIFGGKVGLGMQVLEDSLCNWQKSPDHYVRFRG